MQKLNNQELERITGGSSTWVALGIAAAVVFLAGVIEGIVHPKPCS